MQLLYINFGDFLQILVIVDLEAVLLSRRLLLACGALRPMVDFDVYFLKSLVITVGFAVVVGSLVPVAIAEATGFPRVLVAFSAISV